LDSLEESTFLGWDVEKKTSVDLSIGLEAASPELIGKVARFMQGPLSLVGSLAFLVGPAARYCPPRHPYAFFTLVS